MLGSTLVAFVEGISKVKQLGHIEKIKLTLTTTVMSVIRDTNITVFQGDEDLWDFAKDAFRDKMKQEMTEAQANKVKARFRILVEPFYEQEEFEF
jgi:predicted nucleotidyltransferase